MYMCVLIACLYLYLIDCSYDPEIQVDDRNSKSEKEVDENTGKIVIFSTTNLDTAILLFLNALKVQKRLQ